MKIWESAILDKSGEVAEVATDSGGVEAATEFDPGRAYLNQ